MVDLTQGLDLSGLKPAFITYTRGSGAVLLIRISEGSGEDRTHHGLKTFSSGSFRDLPVYCSSDNSSPAPGALTHVHARSWQGFVAGTADGKTSKRPKKRFQAISGTVFARATRFSTASPHP